MSDLTAAAQLNDVGQFDRPAPLPLVSELRPASPFPLEALGSVLGPAAIAIADCVQCPDAVAGQSVLAAASLAVQDIADVLIDGRSFPLSLFCLTVAESGDRKSGADQLALSEHQQWQKAQRQQYTAQVDDYEVEMTAYHLERDQITKSKSESIAHIADELRDLGAAPAAPVSPTLLMREPTLEAIQKSFLQGLPSQGLFSDEGGQFFGGHAMSRDNQLKTITGLSSLWGGDPIIRSRAGEGESFVLDNPRLSVHLMVQPIVAEKVLSDPLMSGQGFLARLLIAWPVSLAGTRFYNHKDPSTHPDLVRYNAVMQALLERPKRMDENGDLLLDAIVPTEEAKGFWVDAYNTIEQSLAEPGELREIKATACKAAEQMARMAALITLISDPNATSIPLAAMKHAGELIEYYLQEALRLNQVAETDSSAIRAKVLLDWLQSTGWKCVTMTQLSRQAPRGTKARGNVKAMRHLVSILVAHDCLYPLPTGLVIDGRAVREAWEIGDV
jgi:hypothetical protein